MYKLRLLLKNALHAQMPQPIDLEAFFLHSDEPITDRDIDGYDDWALGTTSKTLVSGNAHNKLHPYYLCYIWPIKHQILLMDPTQKML